jgi:5-methyltetrahydropteroyltriglutamate--homocysteine methyltransferase
VAVSALGEGSLNLLADCQRAAAVAQGPFKFTVTSPYMLARTLLDHHYGSFEKLTLALGEVLAAQMPGLPATCIQVDEANIPGNPADAPLAARSMNLVLDGIDKGTERAVHFCFGNYGGQTIQKGNWKKLVEFLNALHTDHLVLELAHRPKSDLDALKHIDKKIALGVGVIDIKVNHIETPDEVACTH